MARCVECDEEDSPGRIVPLSYCDHRTCMEFRRPDCRDNHVATCPSYCGAVGRTPRPPAIQQLDLFAAIGHTT